MNIASILDTFSADRISGLLNKANALAGSLALMLEKRAQRRVLVDMTDDQLRDIGLSRCDATREASRSFWL